MAAGEYAEVLQSMTYAQDAIKGAAHIYVNYWQRRDRGIFTVAAGPNLDSFLDRVAELIYHGASFGGESIGVEWSALLRHVAQNLETRSVYERRSQILNALRGLPAQGLASIDHVSGGALSVHSDDRTGIWLEIDCSIDQWGSSRTGVSLQGGQVALDVAGALPPLSPGDLAGNDLHGPADGLPTADRVGAELPRW